jgi:hypothetical protein
MGAKVRYKLSDGRMLEVPDEDIDEFESKLNSSGLKAEAMGASDYAGAEADPQAEPARAVTAEMTVGEPEVIRTPQRQPLRERDALDDLADTGAGGFVAGIGHGATLGAASLAPGDLGGNYRANDSRAREQSPYAYAAGDMLGSIVSPANKLVPGGGGAVARVAKMAGYGGVEGGVRSFADSDPSDEDRAINALLDAGKSAGASVVLGTAAESLAGLATGAGAVRDRARLAAGKIGTEELDAFARQNKLDPAQARRMLVDEGERMVPPNWAEPRNANEIYNQYKGPAGKYNSQIQDSIDAARNAGAQMPPNVNAGIAKQLYGQADDAVQLAGGGNAAMQRPYMGAAEQVQQSAPVLTPEGLRTAKTAYNKNAYGGAAGTPESNAGIANRAAASAYGDQLEQYVGQGGPQAAADFAEGNRGYNVASTWRDAAYNNALKQETAGPSLDGGSNVLGKLMGALPGASYLPDFVGNVASGVESTLGAAGNATNWMAEQAPTAITALSRASRESRGEKPISQSEDSNQPIFKDSRGDQLGVRMLQVVKSTEGREAMRPWEDELMKADTPDEATAIVQRLMASDPTFARTLSPFLQGRNR